MRYLDCEWGHYMVNDLVKLIILLSVVAAVILGLNYLGRQEDMQNKYHHPITRPGARW